MNLHSPGGKARMWRSKAPLSYVIAGIAATLLALGLSSCSKVRSVGAEANAQQDATAAGVVNVVKKTLSRELTLSSEMVPFQEIDVYAKESGYVQKLFVDYGSRVKAGQVMANLEIPELRAQIDEDQAEIENASHQSVRAEDELKRYEAQYKTLHLEYTRLDGVFETQPGIVAQQEVDDAQGRDLSAASLVDEVQAA